MMASTSRQPWSGRSHSIPTCTTPTRCGCVSLVRGHRPRDHPVAALVVPLAGRRSPGRVLQMVEARERGPVMRGEADYQLPLIYLWYENRTADAMAVVHELQARYPHIPLFHHIEAEIHDAYLSQCGCQLRGVATPPRAGRGPSHARTRDRHGPRPANMAVQLGQLGDRARVLDLLTALVAARPVRPSGSLDRARVLLAELRTSAERRPRPSSVARRITTDLLRVIRHVPLSVVSHSRCARRACSWARCERAVRAI